MTIRSVIAGETIQNNSVCKIQYGELYRLRGFDNARDFPLVYVNNVAPSDVLEIDFIEEGQMCRCFDCMFI